MAQSPALLTSSPASVLILPQLVASLPASPWSAVLTLLSDVVAAGASDGAAAGPEVALVCGAAAFGVGAGALLQAKSRTRAMKMRAALIMAAILVEGQGCVRRRSVTYQCALH